MWNLLPEEDRTLYCPGCWQAQIGRGEKNSFNPLWTLECVTTCCNHGKLSDTERSRDYPRDLRHIEAEARQQTRSSPIAIRFPRSSSWDRLPKCVVMGLGDDVRSIHLENALLKEQLGYQHVDWWPAKVSSHRLEKLYRSLVISLCAQFGWSSATSRREFRPFVGMPNEARYSINVMVEAVLAIWLDTPLPDVVSHERSQALVEVIGWGPERADFNHAGYPGGCTQFALAPISDMARCIDLIPLRYGNSLRAWLRGLIRSEHQWQVINLNYVRKRGVYVPETPYNL